MRILGGLNRGLRMNLTMRHQSQLLLGLAETETFRYFRKQQNRIVTGIDVGANEGYYTLFFSARSSATKIIAFEPLAWLKEQIEANIGLNEIDPGTSIAVVSKLVGSEESTEMTTLDAYVDEVRLPCFVKIDVDGPEADVLRGAAQLLATQQVYLMIETHTTEAEADCIDILTSANYATEIIPNAQWRRIVPENRHGPHNRWLYAEPVQPNSAE